MRDLKKAILECLSPDQRESTPSASAQLSPLAHKINLIGRPYQQGEVERHIGRHFSDDERAIAAQAFEALKRDSYIQPTYSDLADPENWVRITAAGIAHLRRDMKDNVDIELEKIGAHLVELRQGMWAAIERATPDAARQAAHSARELVDQVLKEGAPGYEKRRERITHLLRQHDFHGHASKTDLSVIEAHCDVVEAEQNRLSKNAHLRGFPNTDDVRGSLHAAERILGLIFKIDR